MKDLLLYLRNIDLANIGFFSFSSELLTVLDIFMRRIAKICYIVWNGTNPTYKTKIFHWDGTIKQHYFTRLPVLSLDANVWY